MPLMIFFVIFGIFIIMWFLGHHKNDFIKRNVHRGEHIKFKSETSSTSMQHVHYTYSSGCSACESHDLKIRKPFSKNIFVINSYNSS